MDRLLSRVRCAALRCQSVHALLRLPCEQPHPLAAPADGPGCRTCAAPHLHSTKRLQYVEACFNASTFEHIDCVGAPYFPDSTRRGSSWRLRAWRRVLPATRPCELHTRSPSSPCRA